MDVRCHYSADLWKLGDEEEAEDDDEQPRGSVCPHLPPAGSITSLTIPRRVLLHCACAPDLVRRGHGGRGGAGRAQLGLVGHHLLEAAPVQGRVPQLVHLRREQLAEVLGEEGMCPGL